MKLLPLLAVVIGMTWANECLNIAADEMCAKMANMGECENNFSMEYCALACGACKAGKTIEMKILQKLLPINFIQKADHHDIYQVKTIDDSRLLL